VDSEETSEVLDVHPPHEPVHGWRDFFLHLTIITIGLLIALSLEGLVEWQHHRHLVHEAEASMGAEIRANSQTVKQSLDEVHKQQGTLKQDISVLKFIERNKKAPKDAGLEITFNISPLRNVSWLTAQSTGALSHMPYGAAEEYAEIYGTQALLDSAEQQAARDAILALGPLATVDDAAPDPTEGHAREMREKVQVFEGQLLLVDSVLKGLDHSYTKFLAAHPE